ncbi:MAG TPA: BACON domain-containing carbohydrate-binding protein [Verrucomicrobiae bacterium]|jgi:sugar lactone lactonase YvrE
MPALAAAYSLGTTRLLMGPAAGTNSVVLSVSTPAGGWTSSANAPWLHVNMSGQGKTNIIFTCDSNSGPTRSGTLTIANITLTVTQAGVAYTAAGTPVTLAADVLIPEGVAVDGAGNVYFSDAMFGTIEKWTPASNNHTALVSGLGEYLYVALDASNNVYISDYQNNLIKEWNADSGIVTTLVSSGLDSPSGIAVDGAGNIYIADLFDYAVKEWSPVTRNLSIVGTSEIGPLSIALDAATNIYVAYANSSPINELTGGGNVTTLVPSGLNQPYGLAVDGSGNMYIGDTDNNALKKWSAVTGTVTTLASSQPHITGVAVDGAGNIYFADDNSAAIMELPFAFVNPASKTEPMTAGADSLPPVLPATANLLAPFNPTSDQSWLAITGVASGVVSYSFTANSGPSRTAHISLLGQSISIIQAGFTLGAISLLEGPGAGADSVVLAASPGNAAWTAASDSPWLHTSQSGAGSANVIFSFDANPGQTRIGSLTIAGQPVAVTQAGAAYVADQTPARLAANLPGPTFIAVDQSGNVYIPGYNDGSLREWIAANNRVSTLISNNLQDPVGVALDPMGNISISQIFTIQKFTPATGTLTNVITNSVYFPDGMVFDSSGNLYFADSFNNAIKERPANNNTVITLLTNGLFHPEGIAMDAASNIYVANFLTNYALMVFPPGATNPVILASSNNLAFPDAIAVDGGGNVYIADGGDGAVKEWNAASSNVIALVPASLGITPDGLALDGAGNIYFSDFFKSNLFELPKAFVDPSPRHESAAAGNDSLPTVLPSNQNLLAPFNPVSDQSWLTIAGAANGVVHFSFAANSGASRTAHITLLGQSIPVIQAAYSATPSLLTGAQVVAPGVVQFVFTNTTSPTFTILSTTNLQLPLSNWTVFASLSNASSGIFLYTSPPTTNDSARFYRVRSP